MSDEIKHLTAVPEQPRDPGLAGRIAQVRRVRDPSLKQGLCPSCLNTGYVHEERGGEVGVVYDHLRHGLMWCECSLAKTKREKLLRELETEHARA